MAPISVSLPKGAVAVAKNALEFAFNDKRVRPITINAKLPATCQAVLYWMSRDQRVQDNWAMLYAQRLALQYKAKLFVAFCLVPKFHEATIRHYTFLLEGLKHVEGECSRLSIPFSLQLGLATDRLPPFVRDRNIGVVVTDFSPLRTPLEWVRGVANKLPENVPLFQVDAHNIVPCWVASSKQEVGARTLRPKIQKLLPEFLTEYPPVVDHAVYNADAVRDPVDWQKAYDSLEVDRTVLPITWATPGYPAGLQAVQDFIDKRLKGYNNRNDPIKDTQSQLSPWFKYGHLSAQRSTLKVLKLKNAANKEAVDSFIEESVSRRELSDNFCFYNQNYDNINGAPNWARESLAKHSSDVRTEAYSNEDIEAARTYDDLWNAAHMQMRHHGKMHGFLRMYWAKKILEWTPSPAEALKLAIYLNDRYSIDGRDPNGYTGCMWSICGVHDMGWTERAIFGKIRYMNYAGCRRKFDVDAFVEQWRQFIPPRKRIALETTEAKAVNKIGSKKFRQA